ncbi:MAG: GH92 family glycosyl hydrolase [Bacteroidota bacterium]
MAWVDPNIGAVADLLAPTVPTVQTPHGMIRLAPDRTPQHPDPWLGDHIVGFPLNIISHRGPRAFTIAARTGGLGCRLDEWASEADHDFEAATPHEYAVLLEDYGIEAAYTAAEHAMIYRFRFTRPGWSHILFRARGRGFLEILPNGKEIRGREEVAGVPCHFHARFSRPFDAGATSAGGQAPREGAVRIEGEEAAAYASFEFKNVPQDVEVRIGFSYIDLDQARANLAQEVADRSFAQVSAAGRAAWREALAKITIEGGTERERRIFYTALWRCHERPLNLTERGRYYSAYDHRVHEEDGPPFFADDWLWDTHRTLHPLRLILDPERERAILESYARMIRQGGGWAPVFPLVTGNRAAMIGNHLAAVAADAHAKGLRGFDLETIYAGLRKNAMEGTRLPFRLGPATELDQVYLEKGFFPALAPDEQEWVAQVHPAERRQAVSVTLEAAYDDWCLAELAAALGETADAAVFLRRAMNYRNLYHDGLGVMAPRAADGRWIEPFDPGLSGGQGGRDYYTECNAWTWSWNVPHDVAGLIELMGGRERFLARLDQLFNQPLGVSKWRYLGQFPDATGLVGQFCMGNEPSFLIPYLYVYAGAPWRTQKRVRQLMEIWFDDTPRGLCGDDDGGALSSWYVFSAMGFYPLCPGRPVYAVGSPLFERVSIHLGSGGPFTIIARNVSKQNKYVQAAVLNGRELHRPWFTHGDLVPGGSLLVEMGPRPNRAWGTRPEDAPPSMSRP